MEIREGLLVEAGADLAGEDQLFFLERSPDERAEMRRRATRTYSVLRCGCGFAALLDRWLRCSWMLCRSTETASISLLAFSGPAFLAFGESSPPFATFLDHFH